MRICKNRMELLMRDRIRREGMGSEWNHNKLYTCVTFLINKKETKDYM